MLNYLVVGVCLQIFFLSVVVGEVAYVVDRMRWWDRVVPYTDAEDYIEILFEVVCFVGTVCFYASYVVRWVMLAVKSRRLLDNRLATTQRNFVLWVICRWSFFLYTLYLNDPLDILSAYWVETLVMVAWAVFRPRRCGWDFWSAM